MAISVLKVSLGQEVRRLRVALPDSLEGAAWLQEVRAAVAQGFGLTPTAASSDSLNLTYKDEEGDMCTLIEVTVPDCIILSGGSTLRLFAELRQFQHEIACVGDQFQSNAVVEKREPRVGDVVWASSGCKARIILVETHFDGLQPRLSAGHRTFEIKVCHEDMDEVFDGSTRHVAVLERCFEALGRMSSFAAGTPCWHRVELADGCSIALRMCIDHRLHLCIQHPPSSAPRKRTSVSCLP